MEIKLYNFKEHAFEVKGEKHELLEFVRCVRDSECEGTLSDLAFKIEVEFGIIE